MSARSDDDPLYPGFLITRRNVDKTGLTIDDFVFVAQNLIADNALSYSGSKDSKPSIDAPIHRVIYEGLPWVRGIVHGHLQAHGECVASTQILLWPCGAENEGHDIVRSCREAGIVGRQDILHVINVTNHGFVALLGRSLQTHLETLSRLEFTAK